jgi:hypothetical protein
MAASDPQSNEPIAADGAALIRILTEAGVTRERPVRVTGRAGLTAVFWLCRNGYQDAAYVHPNWIGRIPAATALLIPHACRAKELLGLLHGAAGCEDRLLIVQACSGAPAEGEDEIGAALAALGYRVEDHLSDANREIFIARSHRLPRFSRAA